MTSFQQPCFVVVVAGGKGLRMGHDLPKQFLPIGGLPVLMHTLNRFAQAMPEAELLLVLPQAHTEFWESLCQQYAFAIPHRLVVGGDTRFQSVNNGLSAIQAAEGLVAIHDGVRPFASAEVIRRSFELAAEKGTAIAAVPLKDSIREMLPNGNAARDRTAFRLIQTPQTFRLSLIKSAFQTPELPTFTDDASVAEQAGFPIHLFEGNYENIKITTPEDLAFAEILFTKNKS